MKKQKTKKCPVCKGTGKVKVDDTGLTRAERKARDKIISDGCNNFGI